MVTELFVVKNGYKLSATQSEKYLTFLSLAEGTLSEEALTEWLRERLVRSA